jgi:hypothetical protein
MLRRVLFFACFSWIDFASLRTSSIVVAEIAFFSFGVSRFRASSKRSVKSVHCEVDGSD